MTAREGSLYAATYRQYPGPGTYEGYSSIRTPRGSPRGTFGTGPQRATFVEADGPQPGQYSPRVRGNLDSINLEHSFPKGKRFSPRHLTGDPGSYNPRPRSETRAPSAFSLGARRVVKTTSTPGPGAHEITRFGDTAKFDSFQKPMNQPSPRYSFGTLARPLTLSQSAQSMRRTPRSDFKAGGAGMSSPRHSLMLGKKDTNVYAPAEHPAHLVTHAQPSSGDVGPGQYTMQYASSTATAPSYTMLAKKEEKHRFISKEHSMANNFGETSPGPAIYSCHMEIGVGCKPTIPKHRSNQSVVPILKGEYLRGPMTKPRGPAFGFGTASRDPPGGIVIMSGQ